MRRQRTDDGPSLFLEPTGTITTGEWLTLRTALQAAGKLPGSAARDRARRDAWAAYQAAMSAA